MNEAAELLIRNLAAAAKADQPVDIHRLLGDMTMQVVGTTAFGRAPCTPPRAHLWDHWLFVSSTIEHMTCAFRVKHALLVLLKDGLRRVEALRRACASGVHKADVQMGCTSGFDRLAGPLLRLSRLRG